MDLVVVVVGVVVGGAAVGLNLLGEKLRRPGVLLRPKGRDLKRKRLVKVSLMLPKKLTWQELVHLWL